MTELLEKAIAASRLMTPDMQDAVARLILDFAATDEIDDSEIPPEHLAAIAEGLADLDAGRFVSSDEVWAQMKKYTV